MAEINRGINIEDYAGFRDKSRDDRAVSDRVKTAVARWVQGEESEVSMGGKTVTIGADGGLNMMEMLLASYAACDAAVVALHASYLGIRLNGVTVEAEGHFNVASYVGVDGAPGSGYDWVKTRITVESPDEITQEQLDHITQMCHTGSPVGDTLTREVEMSVSIKQG